MLEKKTNIFQLPSSLPSEEVFESLLSTEQATIERILSAGQTTPAGEWYDQETDEWVVLLQGEAELSDEWGKSMALRAGDAVWIPAHAKHRVEYTSSAPPCIWLAIHLRKST